MNTHEPGNRDEMNGLMKKDCLLILEAIRRLVEGTCCLLGEEKECVWDLFHRTREALLDHIEYEEHWTLPALSSADRAAHAEAHQELMRKLEEVRYEFDVTDGTRFRARFLELAQLLTRHHARYDTCENGDARMREAHSAGDPNLLHIEARIERGMVG